VQAGHAGCPTRQGGPDADPTPPFPPRPRWLNQLQNAKLALERRSKEAPHDQIADGSDADSCSLVATPRGSCSSEVGGDKEGTAHCNRRTSFGCEGDAQDFACWLGRRKPLFRLDQTSWEYPLAKSDKRELLLLQVAAGEEEAMRGAEAAMKDVIRLREQHAELLLREQQAQERARAQRRKSWSVRRRFSDVRRLRRSSDRRKSTPNSMLANFVGLAAVSNSVLAIDID